MSDKFLEDMVDVAFHVLVFSGIILISLAIWVGIVALWSNI